MKYFQLIQSNIPVQPLLDEVNNSSDVWASATGRQDKIAVQREALSIPLRGLRKSFKLGRKRRDVHESRWTTTSKIFPLACAFLSKTADELACDLGRAKIVCLKAGHKVYPHRDNGEYYRIRGRYHLVLKSSQGSWLRSGNEEVRMQEGQLWWFDNNEIHEAFNDGDEDRIHLIFDMLPINRRAEVELALQQAKATSEV